MATDQAMRHKELFRALLDGELPDANGRFGPYGGRYVPETLMPAIDRLTDGVYGLFTEETFRNVCDAAKPFLGQEIACPARSVAGRANQRYRLGSIAADSVKHLAVKFILRYVHG